MTEREKMLVGDLYLASDPELVLARRGARRLSGAYNRTGEDEHEPRRSILRELLGHFGDGVWIEPPFFCDYGRHIYLAENVYLNFGCVMLDCASIRLGRNVQVGPSVQFYAAHHPINATERIAGPELASPITVEENVWIGGGAILCPGVTIGRNTVIGAGSVVTRDIPPAVVAAGNPCRVLRKLEPFS